MVKILKGNSLSIDSITEVIGLVQGYAIGQFSTKEDSMEELRHRAIQKMLDSASLDKANLIIDFEINSKPVVNGYYEVYCSGNAIRLDD